MAANFAGLLDHERISEVRRFFEANLPSEAAPALAKSLERAELRYAFRQRELARIDPGWRGNRARQEIARALQSTPNGSAKISYCVAAEQG